VYSSRLCNTLYSAFIFAAATLYGCASGIRVTQVSDQAKPAKGNPWNLPMTQFTVTITRHLTACGDDLKGTVEVIATPTTAIDRDQKYVLEGSGWWGTSDITSTLSANGTSSGLNAQSTDATATVISNVVSVLGQVAVGALTLAPPAPGQPPPPSPPVCKDVTKDAVEALYPPPGSTKKPLKTVVDSGTAALAAATAKVTLLTIESAIDPARKPTLLTALDQQSALQIQLNSDQAALAKALQATTDTQVVTWPTKGSEVATTTPFNLDDGVLTQWAPGAKTSEATKEFSVYMAMFVPDDSPDGWVVPKLPQKSDLTVGVPVRLGQVVRLMICRKSACTADKAKPGIKEQNITGSYQTVLQLGQVYTVPLTGGTFKAETAAISLDANGLPTSIQVAEKSSAATALSGAAKDTTTQLAALPGQVAAARLAATQAKTTQLTANAALITAQANASIVGKTSGLGAQTALVNAQTALTTAQINAGLPLQTSAVTSQTALLSAQAALVTAQANAQTGDQTSALSAQTTLLNAETAKINATAALVKAQVTTSP
jgi:hypothetical protein